MSEFAIAPRPLEYLPANLSRLAVSIRGDTRIPRYTEALTLPESIYEQALVFGREALVKGRIISHLLADPAFRTNQGLSEIVYQERIKPFLHIENKIAYFGADAIIDAEGGVKFVEINSQPQVLGRFDYVRESAGIPPASGSLAREISTLLNHSVGKDDISVIISHPDNAFFGHHTLFAEQSGMPIVSLQNLQTDGQNIYLDDKRVGSIMRLFSTNTLMDRNVVDKKLYEALVSGNVNIFNGLLTPFMGDKLFLYYLAGESNEVRDFVPEMKTLSLGDDLDLKANEDWWLKADARRRLELTVNLNRDDMRGWTGRVLKAMVKGDFSNAHSLLEGRETPTALRYKEYLEGVRDERVGRFLLQKNVEPVRVSVVEGGSSTQVNTLLRAYFVPQSLDSNDVNVHFEILGGKSLRVSLAGLGIPIK